MTSTQAETDQLRGDMQKLRTDIEQLAATLGRMTKVGARQAGEGVCEATRGFRTDFRQTADRVTDAIENNPVAAALGALGVGMLLGKIFAAQRNS